MYREPRAEADNIKAAAIRPIARPRSAKIRFMPSMISAHGPVNYVRVVRRTGSTAS